MKKYFVYLLFPFFATSLTAQYKTDNTSVLPAVVRNEMLEYANLRATNAAELADVKNYALDKATVYLQRHDTSVIKPIPSRYVRQIDDLLTVSQTPAKALRYEIRSLRQLDKSTLQIKIGIYLFFPNDCLSFYKGDVLFNYDISQKKLEIPVTPTDIKRKVFAGVDFLYTDKAAANKKDFRKTANFYSSLNAFIIEGYPVFKMPKDKLWCVISSNDLDAYSFWGFKDYPTTSRYSYPGRIIFDLSTPGYYCHELIHAVMANYSMNIFITEGVATFFSGYSNNTVSLKSGYLEMRKKIKVDTAYREMLASDSTVTDERISFLISNDFYYYVSASLLSAYYKKVGKEKFFKSLFEVFASQTVKESYMLLKKELNIKDIADYISNTPPPDPFIF